MFQKQHFKRSFENTYIWIIGSNKPLLFFIYHLELFASISDQVFVSKEGSIEEM